MNKYQKAILKIKEMNCNITEDWNCEKCNMTPFCAYYECCKTLQELVDKANKYDELQKVYFNNEPMESANLNGVKLQELYDFNSKLIDKKTPKKSKGISICPTCNNTLYINQNFCDKCGAKIDWSDE